MRANGTDALWPMLAAQLADDESYWALGSFGAIAEFTRDRGEPASLDVAGPVYSVVTPRGGVRVTHREGVRAVAFETAAGLGWNQTIALCLPQDEGKMHRRAVLTELGPDPRALREEDKASVMFDMGLDIPHVDVCVRVQDAAAAKLREFAGRNVFEAGNPAMMTVLAANPHRVFVSKFARIEVFQAIPPHDGRSPEGPHTHVLPKLLAHGRTHSANDPIPQGLVPCLSLFPSHPAKDTLGRNKAFQPARHEQFQALLRAYGDPAMIRLKERVLTELAGGKPPSTLGDDDRFSRACVRIALRQAQAAGATSQALARWLEKYERPGTPEPGELSECH